MKKEKGKENKKRRRKRKRSRKNLDDDVSERKEKKEHLLDSRLQFQREETFQKLGSVFLPVSHPSLPASQPPPWYC